MVGRQKEAPLGCTGVDRIVVQRIGGEMALGERGRRSTGFKRRLNQGVNRIEPAVEQPQPRFLHQGDAARRRILNLNQPDHPVTSNFFNASSSTVRPRPGMFSARSMKPSFATGSPSKIYQKSSLPTSTSTGGKYSAMGELRLAMTTW